MVDTVRTLAQLQAILADNTTGDISEQDVRDAVLSVWQNSIPLWTDVAHISGQLVRRPDGHIYAANAAITAGTGFTVGTSGATWTLIVRSADITVASGIAAGTVMQIGPTVSAGDVRALVASNARQDADNGFIVSDTLTAERIRFGGTNGLLAVGGLDGLSFRNGFGQDHITITQRYTLEHGSNVVQQRILGNADVFIVSNNASNILPGFSHTITFTAQVNARVRSFRINPASAGSFRLQLYSGDTVDEANLLFDVTTEVPDSAVTNPTQLFDTDLQAFTPGSVVPGTEFTVVLSQIQLRGGTSTTPVNIGTNGATHPYFDVVYHPESYVDLVNRNNFTQALQTKLINLQENNQPYKDIKERRSSTTLTLQTAGDLQRFEDTGPYTLGLPAGASADDEQKIFALYNNTSDSSDISVTASQAGQTFVPLGFSFPIAVPPGVIAEFIILEVDGTTTTYGIRLWGRASGDTRPISSTGNTLTLGGVAVPETEVRNSAATQNVAATFATVGSIQTGAQSKLTVVNENTQYGINCGITGDATFDLSSSSRIVVPPRSKKTFTIGNNAGSLRISTDTPNVYEYQFDIDDIVTNDGIVMASPPTWMQDIIQAGTGANDDRLIIQPNINGIIDFTFMCTPRFVGNAAQSTNENVFVDLHRNGSEVPDKEGIEATVDRSTTSSPITTPIVRHWNDISFSTGQYFNLSIFGLNNTDAARLRLIDMSMIVKITL